MTPLAVLSLQPTQGHSGESARPAPVLGTWVSPRATALQAGDLIRALEVRTHGRAY